MRNKKIKLLLFLTFFTISILLIFFMKTFILKPDYTKSYHRQNSLKAKNNSSTQNPIQTQSPFESPTPSHTPEYKPPVDFNQLKQKNPDTIAWIKIPNTKIDYPIVYSKDNYKYLHTDFNGQNSIYGTIYLDCDSQIDFSGKNNILYGHNMKDGSMFADIIKYKDETYFKNNRDIYIYTPTREIHLKTLAAFFGNASVESRRTQFSTHEEFEYFVKSRLSLCKYAEVPTSPISSIYTFVTCSYEFYNARTFLYAIED